MRAVVRAHAFMRTECPPEPWSPDADEQSFFRLLGELIAAGLARNGNTLGELTLNVSNVVVDEAAAGPCPAGEFVALTISGDGDWRPERTWPDASQPAAFVSGDLEGALRAVGAAWAYTRVLTGNRGSVTAFLRRSRPA
jgi:hypothetical protein